MRLPKLLLIILFPILLAIGIGVYIFDTATYPAIRNTVYIRSASCYLSDGLFGSTPYMQYEIIPSGYTKPNLTYEIIVKNGLVKQVKNVRWTELELSITKSKPVRIKLSNDEYQEVKNHEEWELDVKEIKQTRNGTYFLLPMIYIGLISFIITKKKKKKKPPETLQNTNAKSSPNPISEKELQRCFDCKYFTSRNGVLRCDREQGCIHKKTP